MNSNLIDRQDERQVDAIRAGTEHIADKDIESWKPILERETMFA
jgi:hypothetical protein